MFRKLHIVIILSITAGACLIWGYRFCMRGDTFAATANFILYIAFYLTALSIGKRIGKDNETR